MINCLKVSLNNKRRYKKITNFEFFQAFFMYPKILFYYFKTDIEFERITFGTIEIKRGKEG